MGSPTEEYIECSLSSFYRPIIISIITTLNILLFLNLIYESYPLNLTYALIFNKHFKNFTEKLVNRILRHYFRSWTLEFQNENSTDILIFKKAFNYFYSAFSNFQWDFAINSTNILIYANLDFYVHFIFNINLSIHCAFLVYHVRLNEINPRQSILV